PRRDAERVLAPDGDERIEPAAFEVRQHALHAAVDLERVGARGAEDRAAAREETGDLSRPERLVETLDEAFPAFADTDYVAAPGHHSPPDGADDGVLARAVAA